MRFGVGRAGDDDRDEEGPVLAHPGQVRAITPEQAARLLHDPIEDDVGFAQGGDPGGDVAQGSLGVGASGEGGLRAFELLDETGIRDGDGGLVGKTAEDRGIDVVEGVPVPAVDLDAPRAARRRR